MTTEPNHNYFDILGVEQKFTQDLNALDNRLQQMQATVHPDNSTGGTSQEKRLMMQYSIMLNEAYTVLKDPLKRACHLLELRGVEMSPDSTESLPMEFLQMQMELREKIEDNKGDRQALKEMQYKTNNHYHSLIKDLGGLLDTHDESHLLPARELVLNLQFFNKVLSDLKDLIDNIVPIDS